MTSTDAHTQVVFPDGMAENSKVWVYQSTSPFSQMIAEDLEIDLKNFISQWAAHGSKLQAFAGVYHHQFICFIVDESAQGASGCSIDSSVHFIQQMESKYALHFFDRMATAFVDRNGVIQTSPLSEMAALHANGAIDGQTLVFNNTVRNLAELRSKWLTPISQSWHSRFL